MTTQQRPVTMDRIRSSKKPAIKSVRIALDPDVLDEFEAKKEVRDFAQLLASADTDNASYAKDLKEAETAYREAESAFLKSSVKFTFRAIGRRKYDDLVEAHRPGPSQKTKWEEAGNDPAEMPQWNFDTFPVALIAASLTEPLLTEEEVGELYHSDDWSGPELMTLFNTALVVNTQNRVVDAGKG